MTPEQVTLARCAGKNPPPGCGHSASARDIECLARDLETRGRPRATITRRLCAIAGLTGWSTGSTTT